MTLALIIAGLILIISCSLDRCYKEDYMMAAGTMQCVSGIFTGYLSFLYNPRVIIVYS